MYAFIYTILIIQCYLFPLAIVNVMQDKIQQEQKQ